jgi:hypothetical protein
MRNTLKIAQHGQGYRVKVGGDWLRTPGGLLIETPLKALAESMISDLASLEDPEYDEGILLSPRGLSLYLIKSTEQDFIDQGQNPFDDLVSCIVNDPLFSVPAGHPLIEIHQMQARQPARDFFAKRGLRYQPVLQRYTEGELNLLSEIYQEALQSMTAPQLASLVNLATVSGHQFTFSILFIFGLCTRDDFARMCFSTTRDVVLLVGERPLEGFSVQDDRPDDIRQGEVEAIHQEYLHICDLCYRYLTLSGYAKPNSSNSY